MVSFLLHRPPRPLSLGLLLLATTLHAEAQSTWYGSSTDNNWSSPYNWDFAPTSGQGAELIFDGIGPLSVQDMATPFQLTSLSFTGSTSHTISGGPLEFVSGTSMPSITTESGTASFRIDNELRITTPTNFVVNAQNHMGNGLVLGGPIVSNSTINVQAGAVAPIVILAHANNVNFAGTYFQQAGGVTHLGVPNAVWRTTTLKMDGIGGIGTYALALPGARNYSQQVGHIQSSNSSGFTVGNDTSSVVTVLAGYLNLDAEFRQGGLAGSSVTSHFGKVGIGTYSFTGNNGFGMALSIRGGTFRVAGSRGGFYFVGVAPVPGAITIYGNSQFRVDNSSAFQLSASYGRFADNLPMRGAGGTLRIDGNVNLVVIEKVGVLRPFAGHSVIVANHAGQQTTLEFSSLNFADLIRGGQVAFVGDDPGDKSRFLFTSAPSTVGELLPWALAQTDYVAAPLAATNSTNPNALAIFTSNGVMPLSSYIDDDFTAGSTNVRITTPMTVAAPPTINSFTLDAGGSLVLGDALNITSGAIMNRAVGATISGGTIVTPGRFYLNSVQPLVIDSGITVAGLSKGGSGSVTLNGQVAPGNNALLSVNAGTLAFGPTATLLNAVTIQVAKGATISNIPGSVTKTLRGAGTVTGPVTIADGGVIVGSALAGGLSDGASPGTLTLTGPLTLHSGATIRMYLSSVFGGEYTHSMIHGTTLDLTGTDYVVLQPVSLDLNNETRGPLYDAIAGEQYSWTIGIFPGGIVGFDPDKFHIDTTLLGDGFDGAEFVFEGAGGVHYRKSFSMPVPEPALIGILGLAAIRFRISRQVSRGR